MLAGRIQVPWGAEPTAQVVEGLTKPRSWDYENSARDKPQNLKFESIASKPDIIAIYKPTPEVIPRRRYSEEVLDRVLKWAVARVIREAKPPRAPSVVMLATPPRLPSSPLSLVQWAFTKLRRRIKIPKPTKVDKLTSRVEAIYPKKQQWRDLMPPSVLALATERAIHKDPAESIAALDPFSTKSNVISLERRRQVAVALQRGEWCLVDEIDIFPLRLRLWLISCNIRLVRYIGRRIVEGGGTSGAPGTPVNGYVAEDGTTFYVAEDGSTFYVQET